MSSPSDALSLAGDVIVVCVILSLAIFCVRAASKATQVTTANLNKTTTEYVDSEISTLLSNTHTGATVKKYISKYSHEMTVQLSTLESLTAGVGPAIYNATTSSANINDVDSLYYVEPDAMFLCEADKDTNGNYVTIRFIQQGETYYAEGELVSNSSEAKSALIEVLGLQDSASWQDIYNATLATADVDKDAKRTLVEALGIGSVDNNSSWSEITESTKDLLDSYRVALGQQDTVQHNKDAFTLAYNEVHTLEFSPEVVVVYASVGGGDSIQPYCWVKDSGWVTDLPHTIVTIEGTKIKHVDSLNMNDTVYVIAYN